MLKEYPEYKETGLPWCPIVPKHWNLLRNKNVFIPRKELVENRADDFDLLSLTKQGVIVRDIDNGKGKFPKDFETYLVVNPDDIIFCLFDIDETPRTVGLSKNKGMITGAYDVFSIKNVQKEFVYYYYLFLDNFKLLKPLYSGLRKTIKPTLFLSIKLPIPPISEQNAIVKYLDFKTKQIDEFVSAKEKEITLLEEFKRSLISDYVSKGNSQTEMKESGIEWIHKIPKHWKTLMLFQCAEEYFKSNKDIHHQNLLSLSYGKIKRKDINTKGGLLPESFDNYQVVKKGNIILRLTDLQNDHKSLRTGLVTETGIITSAYLCINPRENVIPEYLHWILHSCDLHKVFYGMGGGVRQSIGYADISKMYFPIPPIDEQNEIVKYLDKKTSEIDMLIASIQKQIALVRELRTKLIADAVTGRIDVREVV